MRRMILLSLGFGLLGAAVGCHYTAGVCDCEKSAPPVMHAEPAPAQGAPVGAPVIHAEPIH